MGVERACTTAADTAESEETGQTRADTPGTAGKLAHASTLKHPDELRDGKPDSYRSRNPHLQSHLQLPPSQDRC